MVAPPHAELRDRCSLPGLAGLTGQRWQDRKHASKRVKKLFEWAEREGFEPPVPFGTHDFQSCTFDHSVISPWAATAKVQTFLAEGMGFEPTVPLRAHRISNPAP
jgi:hypothetical protein